MTETLRGRLNFRLNTDQEHTLRQAAALTGQSLTGFVLSSAVEHAHEVLERANHIQLSSNEFQRFIKELDKPAELAPELVSLLNRRSNIPES